MRLCDGLLAVLREGLPRTLDADVLSPFAKVPYKASVVDANLGYRLTELAEATLQLLHSRCVVAAALTARAAAETAALHFYVTKKIEDATTAGRSADADAILVRALTGAKFPATPEPPINVLTAIDHTTKAFSIFRDMYDELSEFAHPNWLGTHAPYAVENETEFRVTFDPHFGGGMLSRRIATALSIALIVDGVSRRALRRIMPAFTALCEHEVRQLPSASTLGSS